MVNQSSRSRTTPRRGLPCIGLGAVLLTATPLGAQSPPATMPDSVREYIREAMAAFRAHSVHRTVVDWPALEDSVVVRSAAAQMPSDTWRALIWALRKVDRHSFLRPTPDRMAELAAALTGGTIFTPSAPARPSAVAPKRASPSERLFDDGIALVAVPPHDGRNRPSYVDSLQMQIGALDSAGACGWVVDLRQNTGGNMWPMLAGVGPLLGAELVGSFTNSPSGAGWRYRDGRSWSGDSTQPAEALGWGSIPPRRVRNPAAPVALLVGRETASSGEMTMLAFLGRPHVRSFGDSTAGYTSSNTNVPLRDGTTLVVTSSYPRDRLGRTYPLTLSPDEFVPSDSAGDDAPLRRATAWLRQHPACAGRD